MSSRMTRQGSPYATLLLQRSSQAATLRLLHHLFSDSRSVSRTRESGAVPLPASFTEDGDIGSWEAQDFYFTPPLSSSISLSKLWGESIRAKTSSFSRSHMSSSLCSDNYLGDCSSRIGGSGALLGSCLPCGIDVHTRILYASISGDRHSLQVLVPCSACWGPHFRLLRASGLVACRYPVSCCSGQGPVALPSRALHCLLPSAVPN